MFFITFASYRWPVMIESYREQHPLLCDDEVSEDELCSRHYNPHYFRRSRSMNYRTRARNKVKGAAAIIIRWPDHWSSILVYWWIGFTAAMIGFTIFIIYNNIVTLTLFTSTKAMKLVPHSNKTENSLSTKLPEIYMHVIMNNEQKVEWNKYLPHIASLANKFLDFQYNLILVLNETSIEFRGTNEDERNNEIALDSLWDKQDILNDQKLYKNIKLKYVYLSNYIDNSPLRKRWKHLPPHLIEFLIRAISIWDKGGIAFNPLILASQATYTIYVEKLEHILKKFKKPKSRTVTNKLESYKHIDYHMEKSKKKVNNIRDIIEALESDDKTNPSEQNLTEVENAVTEYMVNGGRKLLSAEESTQNNVKYISKRDTIKVTTSSLENEKVKQKEDHGSAQTIPLKKNNINDTGTRTNEVYAAPKTYSISKLKIVPLFLDFLFHENSISHRNASNTDMVTRKRKSVVDNESIINNGSLVLVDSSTNISKNGGQYKPVIITNKDYIRKKIDDKKKNVDFLSNEYNNKPELIIDLKGNIIATTTACHAFIGTIFSNANHHTSKETVTDFIVEELTLFCNGLLSTCNGIDVILI